MVVVLRQEQVVPVAVAIPQAVLVMLVVQAQLGQLVQLVRAQRMV